MIITVTSSLVDSVVNQIGAVLVAVITTGGAIYAATRSVVKKLNRIDTAVGGEHIDSAPNTPDAQRAEGGSIYSKVDQLTSEVRLLSFRLDEHITHESGPGGQYDRLMKDLEPIKRFVLGYSGSRLADAESVNTLLDDVEDLKDRLDAIEARDTSGEEPPHAVG